MAVLCALLLIIIPSIIYLWLENKLGSRRQPSKKRDRRGAVRSIVCFTLAVSLAWWIYASTVHFAETPYRYVKAENVEVKAPTMPAPKPPQWNEESPETIPLPDIYDRVIYTVVELDPVLLQPVAAISKVTQRGEITQVTPFIFTLQSPTKGSVEITIYGIRGLRWEKRHNRYLLTGLINIGGRGCSYTSRPLYGNWLYLYNIEPKPFSRYQKRFRSEPMPFRKVQKRFPAVSMLYSFVTDPVRIMIIQPLHRDDPLTTKPVDKQLTKILGENWKKYSKDNILEHTPTQNLNHCFPGSDKTPALVVMNEYFGLSCMALFVLAFLLYLALPKKLMPPVRAFLAVTFVMVFTIYAERAAANVHVDKLRDPTQPVGCRVIALHHLSLLVLNQDIKNEVIKELSEEPTLPPALRKKL